MNDLKSTKALVKAILEQDEKARNSDSYLYFKVINTIADRNNIDLNKITIPAFLLEMSKSHFPPFESVRRTRQKAQAECPDLAACERVAEFRAENEVVYHDFARG
jgi:hypothetical protein